MPSVVQLGPDLVEEHPGVRLGDGLAARRRCGPAARAGRARRRCGRRGPVSSRRFRPGHPHHVELVEVGREDRQELGPLQQRLAGVLGQREHPGVEVEPGQLAVEVAVVGQLGGGRRGAGGRARPGRAATASAGAARARPAGSGVRATAGRLGRARGGAAVVLRAARRRRRSAVAAARLAADTRRGRRAGCATAAERSPSPRRLAPVRARIPGGCRLASSPTAVILSHPGRRAPACGRHPSESR